MDITFNGFTYKDVEVGLDQRPRSGSDLLVNRDLMRLMNLSVNPNRTFVLSKRLRPIEKEADQIKLGLLRNNIDFLVKKWYIIMNKRNIMSSEVKILRLSTGEDVIAKSGKMIKV